MLNLGNLLKRREKEQTSTKGKSKTQIGQQNFSIDERNENPDENGYKGNRIKKISQK